jgi:hypothetical protein
MQILESQGNVRCQFGRNEINEKESNLLKLIETNPTIKDGKSWESELMKLTKDFEDRERNFIKVKSIIRYIYSNF